MPRRCSGYSEIRGDRCPYDVVGPGDYCHYHLQVVLGTIDDCSWKPVGRPPRPPRPDPFERMLRDFDVD